MEDRKWRSSFIGARRGHSPDIRSVVVQSGSDYAGGRQSDTNPEWNERGNRCGHNCSRCRAAVGLRR
jgi:hypothetical protein